MAETISNDCKETCEKVLAEMKSKKYAAAEQLVGDTKVNGKRVSVYLQFFTDDELPTKKET